MEATPVSEGVKRIVDYINANPKCTRRKMMEVLAPAPAVLPVNPPAEGQTTATGPEPTPEQTAVVSDLHWLIHQGHVIEFANGTLETAKKPLPRPPKPESKPAAEPGGAPALESESAPAVAESVLATNREAPKEPSIEPGPTTGSVPPVPMPTPPTELTVPQDETPPSATEKNETEGLAAPPVPLG
jgi:hypothetical protein